MKRYRTTKAFPVCMLLVVALMVTGCAGTAVPQGEAETASDSAENEAAGKLLFGSMGSAKAGYGSVLAGQGVQLPVSRPSIYVNESGYVSEGEKIALFVGDKHGDTFDVVRSADGQVVYTGAIPAKSTDHLSGISFSAADLSALTETGTYYICTDIVGQSYPFTVAPDAYEKLFLNLLRNVSDDARQENAQGVCDVSLGMHAILYAIQCNGALFEAAYENLGSDEQDMQLVTQLLYMAKWLTSQQGADGSLYGDYEATAAFCGIMALSRERFGRYEENVSQEYGQAAQRAWEWLSGQECDTDVKKSARFYAAVQLYYAGGIDTGAADGGAEYRKIAETYLTDKNENYYEERFVFYGVISYLGAEKDIDRDLCTHIMLDVTDRTEQICADAKQDTAFGTGVRTVEEHLSNMLLLSFINYLTPSKEYTVVIENTIKYMGGINENGVCCIGADGRWRGVQAAQGRNLEWNGILLFGMSSMLSSENYGHNTP